MRNGCGCVVAVLVILMVVPGAIAQGNRDQQCGEILRELDPSLVAPAGFEVKFLSGYIMDQITLPKFILDESVSPRDLQSRASGPSAASGSAGQGEAVPTVQPMALAGGSLAALGTDDGSSAITSMTINPSMFVTDPQSLEDATKFGRLTDLTVSFPVDDLDRNDDGSIDYYALRARVNLTGIGRGNKLLADAEKTFAQLVNTDAEIQAAVEEILRQTPNLRPCVDALLRQPLPDDEALSSACQMEVRLAMSDTDYETFQRQLTALREKADAYYLGLDLRFEDGDPTLGAVDTASGTALTGAIAVGRTIMGNTPEDPTVAVKARLGVRHVSLDHRDLDEFAVDGGIGFDITRSLEQGHVGVAGGVEFRYGGPTDMEELLNTNFTLLRLSITVPFTPGTDLSLNYARPVDGEANSILSINANWELLLPRK